VAINWRRVGEDFAVSIRRNAEIRVYRRDFKRGQGIGYAGGSQFLSVAPGTNIRAIGGMLEMVEGRAEGGEIVGRG